SRRRHTRSKRDWSSDVCSSDLFLGISGTPDLVPQSPAVVPELVWTTFSRTGELVLTLPVRLYEVGEAAFGGAERDPNGPLGVVRSEERRVGKERRWRWRRCGEQ